MRSISLILFVTMAAVVSAFLLEQADARPYSEVMRRGELDEGDDGALPEAIKYLEELDKYYSQVARPRQRRVGQNMASALEKLSQIRNYYNEAGRPRFGKRSSIQLDDSVQSSFPSLRY